MILLCFNLEGFPQNRSPAGLTSDSMSHEDDSPPVNRFSRALWHFSPQWFLIPQGTGIIAVLLHQLHYQFGALPILAKIVWIYTIALFGITLALYILRVIIHPHHVIHKLRTDLLETSCLASISITFTSIIEMVSLQYGSSAGLPAYILWCISTALAIIAVILIPYTQLKLQPPGIEHIPPSILLPVIAALTSAAGGGVICTSANISPRLQVPTIIISYLEVGTGFALALAFTAIVLLEHFNRTYPTPSKVYQDMVLCGPFGQGGFALQGLGTAVLQGSFASYNRGTFLTAEAARPIAYISQWAGLMSWGFGTFWWCFATYGGLGVDISVGRVYQLCGAVGEDYGFARAACLVDGAGYLVGCDGYLVEFVYCQSNSDGIDI
ncbi:putative malic acid transport protein [Aspergillus affinis]|uniref:putative malic acid transport protein n=1 Tax=Aspergillus affinis TaxID=1070780 RepID=UPI0022FF38D7|nr:putative malic acid transport protein [Aspergillus affinis]KAI9035333.1 putative malic acid transport protein [Aspergillus affinis]